MSLFQSLLASGGPVSVVISTDSHSSVEGIFQIEIVFGVAVTGFAIGDITVTNGTATTLNTDDDITWTCLIEPNGGNSGANVTVSIAAGAVTPSNAASNTLSVSVNSDWAFLTNLATSHLYYEFREIAGINNELIHAASPSLRDFSGNGRTGVRINSPQTRVRSGENGITALEDTGTQAMSIGITGSAFFTNATGFSVNLKFQSSDGQIGTGFSFCGQLDGSSVRGLHIDILGTGNLGFLRIRFIGGFTWQSTAAVLANGDTAVHTFDFHFDFATDVLTVVHDGSAVAGSFTAGNISTTNPANFACAANLYIGALNNNGTAETNSNVNSIYYFSITQLQTSGQQTSVRSYLTNRKANFELVDTLVDATNLKVPHYIEKSRFHSGRAYGACKGDVSLTTVNGGFFVLGFSDPTTLSILGSDVTANKHIDSETTYEISATRVMEFVDDAVNIINVSNLGALVITQTLANSNGVVNGRAVSPLNANLVFGANKGGFVDVFDITTPDSTTLAGSRNTSSADSFTEPHDCEFLSNGTTLAVCSKGATGPQIILYEVLNGDGTLITPASWTVRDSLTDASLDGANRLSIIGDTLISHQNNTGKNIISISVADPTNISILSTLDNEYESAGTDMFLNRFVFAACGDGLRMVDINNPSSITQRSGYLNNVDFTTGSNTNAHEAAHFLHSDGYWYVLLTLHNNNAVACFKLPRI